MTIEAMKNLILGLGAPIAGILVSLSTHIPELQVLSLILGMVVAVLAIVNYIVSLCKSYKNRDK